LGRAIRGKIDRSTTSDMVVTLISKILTVLYSLLFLCQISYSLGYNDTAHFFKKNNSRSYYFNSNAQTMPVEGSGLDCSDNVGYATENESARHPDIQKRRINQNGYSHCYIYQASEDQAHLFSSADFITHSIYHLHK